MRARTPACVAKDDTSKEAPCGAKIAAPAFSIPFLAVIFATIAYAIVVTVDVPPLDEAF